jgi:hypothetical protein
MNCLPPLEDSGRGFEFHSRHGCLCVFYSVFVLSCVQVVALRPADLPSMESYRLCIRLRNQRSGQGPTNGCRVMDNDKYMCVDIFSETIRTKRPTLIYLRRFPSMIKQNYFLQLFILRTPTESHSYEKEYFR